MKQEFSDKVSGMLSKEDFDRAPDGRLYFLARMSEKVDHEGVKIGSQLGSIFTLSATYDGLKKLDQDDRVYSIEHSRPGAVL